MSIDLYTWSTPNGYKVSIMLEECGLDYKVKPVNIREDEQFKPEFLAISPNNRIPAIFDHEGPGGKPISLMESSAILQYLADKTGKFLPKEGEPRYRVLEWCEWQMGNIGPMIGQLSHFVNYAEGPNEYAVNRYLNESVRLLKILDGRLAGREYVADDYSIADMLLYPWVVAAFERIHAMKSDEMGECADLRRWLEAVGARPAVQRGMKVPTTD